jgi:hypothetical protein
MGTCNSGSGNCYNIGYKHHSSSSTRQDASSMSIIIQCFRTEKRKNAYAKGYLDAMIISDTVTMIESKFDSQSRRPK